MLRTLLSLLLGLMFLTSVVGISHAMPIQPTQNSCNPNSPNYDGAQCGAHSGGNPHSCDAAIGFDRRGGCCASVGENPEALCGCFTSITSRGLAISDIQTDYPPCLP